MMNLLRKWITTDQPKFGVFNCIRGNKQVYRIRWTFINTDPCKLRIVSVELLADQRQRFEAVQKAAAILKVLKQNSDTEISLKT